MRLNVGGRELVADFEVQDSIVPGARFSIVLESKNGQGRNPDYFQVLEQLLEILGSQACRIVEIQLVSKHALKFPPGERVLPLNYPIFLSVVDDFTRLRKDICRAQASIITTAKTGSGNSHRKICLEVSSDKSGKEVFGNSSVYVV